MQKAEPTRVPIHVVYGGANLFNFDTPSKLGKIALSALKAYAPDADELAAALGIDADKKLVQAIYEKTIEKLSSEPVEDLRIDFEDGYGFRPDDEEDADAVRSATELAKAFSKQTVTPFTGFRIKGLSDETRGRAVRTLNLFFETFLSKTKHKIPANFVVTLPKVSTKDEVRELGRRLARIERDAGLKDGVIGIEIMIETPRSVIDDHGRVAVADLVLAAEGRCRSAHFGAYDYTSALGISGAHQHLRHDACNFARQLMLVSLAPIGVRVVDSVTTRMPVALHRDARPTPQQKADNRQSVHAGWREHFDNVTASMKNGFYQSWDLHPNQLVARYAAVYTFFLNSRDFDGARLQRFVEKSTQASMTGSTFDDAASANGLLNFFRLGLDCGAFTTAEIKKATGISVAELRSMSFLRLS